MLEVNTLAQTLGMPKVQSPLRQCQCMAPVRALGETHRIGRHWKRKRKKKTRCWTVKAATAIQSTVLDLPVECRMLDLVF